MSMFLEWMNSALILDIPEIDDQHKELFKRIDMLLEAMKKGQGCEEIIPLVIFLEDYVISHFNDEQGIMERYNYPALNEHISEHQEFVQKCRDAKISFQNSGSCSAWVIQFQHLLRNWVKEHIARQDIKMGKFLKERMQLSDGV